MRLFFLLFILISTLYSAQLYNSNLLVENRIDPKIINNIASSTRQGVAYKMAVHHTKKTSDKTETLNYNVIVDPFPSYGTELKIEVPKDQLSSIDTSQIKTELDKLMAVQLYVQHGDLFDINSLELIKHSKNERIISFVFKKDVLPRELKYMRDMKGYVYINAGLLTKIELKNEHRFIYNNIEVESYTKTIYFKTVPNSGYLMSGEDLKFRGLLNEKPYEENIHGVITSYWDVQHQEISMANTQAKKSVDREDEQYTTIAIDLDRLFPLLGQEARKAGYDLPKPFGITFVNMFQKTLMHMNSFKIDGSNVDFNSILDGDSTYNSLTYAPLIRTDVWVLPFVSISAILGATDTSTNVQLVSDSGLTIPIIGEIIKPGSSLNLPSFKTNALLYGVGATVAGGLGNYFTTIDFQYITAYTPEADVSIDMMVITPLIGYSFSDYNTRAFIGAQYQRLAQSLTFSLQKDDQSLSGVIGLQSAEWAGVIGLDYSFTRQWSSNLLYSQGIDRQNFVLSLAYRF